MVDLLWTTLADCISDAVVVLDGDACIVHVNRAAEWALDWPLEALVGQPVETIVPQRLRRPEGMSLGATFLRRASVERHLRGTFLRRDGVEMETDFELSNVVAESGERLAVVVLRLLHTFPEFTSFPGAEGRETTDQERIYRLVFDNAPLGLVHFDERGVVTACNDRFVSIVASERRALVGLNMLSLPHEDLVARVREALAGRATQWEGEYRSILAGKVTPARVLFAPTSDGEGRVTGGVAIVEDVTERRNAEKALALAERMASLGALAAGVAHEINNPLGYATTNTDLVLRLLDQLAPLVDPSAMAAIRQHLSDAREGMDRVRAIVRDLGAFARSDDERRGPVDLERLAEAAVKLAQTELRHRARVVTDFAGVPPALASEPRVVQVLVNLLVNAAHSIEEGRVEDNAVTLTTRRVGPSTLSIEIRDTGRGIAPEHLDKVFEPFWTTKPAGQGIGLGLSICHGIVESLGGRMEAESELGRGSAFRVFLPVAPADSAPRGAPRPEGRRLDGGGGRRRVLVVDDERNLTRTLDVALRGRYDVTIVASGRAALAVLGEDRAFDLVLCDLMIPDLPGPDLYAEVARTMPELAGRFVFMTAGAFTERARGFLRSVPNPRIEKPFHLEALEAFLEESLGGPDHAVP